MENKLNLSFNFSDEDKTLIKEAVKEVVSKAINDFGTHLRQSTNFKDTKATCEALGITKPTLARYRAKGYIQGKRIGSKYFYSEDEIIKAASVNLRYKH